MEKMNAVGEQKYLDLLKRLAQEAISFFIGTSSNTPANSVAARYLDAHSIKLPNLPQISQKSHVKGHQRVHNSQHNVKKYKI